MSNTDASRSFLDGAPFATFNTPGDTRSGVDLFFDSPDLFSFLPPPYNLTDADVLPTPGHPFLTVHPEEISFSTVQVSEDSWKALYFLAHPAIYRLLPFTRVPERICRTDPGYLATILDHAVPVFETLHRAYPLVPHTRTFMKLIDNVHLFLCGSPNSYQEPVLLHGNNSFSNEHNQKHTKLRVSNHGPITGLSTLLAALVRLVLAVRELVPNRPRDDWLAFLPEGESAHSELWDMYPPLSFGWVFPCTQEFPKDQPLRDTFLLTDHVTLQRIASPSFHALAAFLAKGRVYDATGFDHGVQLLDDAITPENATFQTIADEFRAGRLSAHITHAIFNTVQDLIDYLPADRRNAAWTADFIPEDPASASMLLPRWFAIPRGPHEDSLEEPYPVQSGIFATRCGFFPALSRFLRFACGDSGPSAVGSASFDIRQLLGSAKKDPPTPRKASAIAASPSSPTEMQVDPPEMSSADALAIAEALDDLPPHRGPPRGSPSVHPAPAGLRDKKGRPMIRIKSSQKSVTPPASEAYNEEGEEEKDEEEEEEEEEAPPRPAKRRRTAPALPKSKTPGKNKGKGKAQVETPALVDTSSTFPIPVRKTRGKSKKAELPAYVPPKPVPLMDTVSLAAETLASQCREPLVFDAGCSNCILRDHECDHGAPCSLCGNELITDLSAARADYELAQEQLFRASARIAVASNRVSTWIRGRPFALSGGSCWGQLLTDAEAELSVEYRAAIQRYPFISDPRRADLPSDEDLPTLIEFLTRRAAHAHQPTPPPEEELNWPDEVVKPSACVWLVIAILEPRFFLMKIVMLGLISSTLIAPLLSIFGTTLPFHIDLLKEIFSIPPLLIEKLHYLVYKRALE
ncbi:hypothetical protein B0H14DRAFT_3430498 [Mycena olivaceomarginata]|nr:hypothetical protein B0H14DRAFT_3430498 [Mycena olivaceomarginata]